MYGRACELRRGGPDFYYPVPAGIGKRVDRVDESRGQARKVSCFLREGEWGEFTAPSEALNWAGVESLWTNIHKEDRMSVHWDECGTSLSS